jgi:hypothetical protein
MRSCIGHPRLPDMPSLFVAFLAILWCCLVHSGDGGML